MPGSKPSIFILLAFIFPFFLNAQNFGGNPSAIKWRQINTSRSHVIFPAGLDSQANRINNLMFLLDTATAGTIGGRQRKWNIVLLNQTTISNGYVRLAPVLSEFYMTPDQNNFSEGSMRWDDNLVIHENRHMQQFSNFNNGLTKIFSFFLGEEGQLLANGLVIPDYFFEGDAVWQETLVSNQGRGRLPYFFNGLKSLWLGNKHYSWMKLRSGSYKNYTPDHYPLGYLLTAYGNAKYGNDFWRKVTQDATRFKGIFYPFNKAIAKYSGKSYPQFRQDAIAYFKQQSFTGFERLPNEFTYLTSTKKNNVVDYLFPKYISDDSILVVKQSYKSVNTFYLIVNKKEKKILIKNSVIDDYYSYNNGKIVYASYQSDPRWANRDYSVLQLVDIKTTHQKQLTFRSKFFSPDINKPATEILAVEVNPDGSNQLVRLNVATGAIVLKVPNPFNYFYSQPKYIDALMALACARNAEGRICLMKIDLISGATENITPFSLTIVGYPVVKGELVYFNATSGYSDKIFCVNLRNHKIYRLTGNANGVYYPDINDRGELLASAFTADGFRLIEKNISDATRREVSENEFSNNVPANLYVPQALNGKAAGALYSAGNEKQASETYKRSFQLFNFHSRRPVVADPEYGYTFSSDNILTNFTNEITYKYNRDEKSHSVGFNAVYAGWFPVLSIGIEGIFNRNGYELADSNTIRAINFNSAKLSAQVTVPLSFTGGRTNKYLNAGGGYNMEQLYYSGIGKNLFSNTAFQYSNLFFNFSNVNRQAKQQVNPRWAQTLSTSYRYAFNFRQSRKFVGSTNFYFPGLFKNHSILLQGAFQKRDTLSDIFSNTFPYSRGYGALSTRRMYKLGANYQLPILYPDLGFANILFFQRVRANAFFDYSSAHLRLNGLLTEVVSRSTGGELFFDTKAWNALPVTFGVRYSYLLDTDLRNPGIKSRWEFILFNFVPD